MSQTVATRNASPARIGWTALAAFCTAFAVLEVFNHGPLALAGAALFACLPELPLRSARYYALTHRALIPLALLLAYTFSPLTFAPLFAAGLGWLANNAVNRALGRGVHRA